jgi:hypothetical protein
VDNAIDARKTSMDTAKNARRVCDSSSADVGFLRRGATIRAVWKTKRRKSREEDPLRQR